MTGDQIVEYAQRQRYRVTVTESMVLSAIQTLGPPFSCQDVTARISQAAAGRVSEYLVALWLHALLDCGRLRRTGSYAPFLYEQVVEVGEGNAGP